MILPRKFEVALVMAGNAENRAGAIVHQHEIRDVHRQPPFGIERMHHLQPGVEALLLSGLDLGRAGPAGLALGDEAGRLGIRRRRSLGKRMIGRDRDEARPEDRVRPGRKHLDLVDPAGRLGQSEAELQAAAPADPILLHQPDLFRPVVEPAQPVEQLVGELGDLQEPLRELAPLDRRAGAPAAPVDHLLVGEHGHVDRVPIDLALLAIDEAGREQVQEQRLLVAVISGVAGRELAAPVECEADLLQLLAHRPDVGPGPFARVDLALHRRILGRHPERVPAHRVEHFMPLHPPVPGDDVAHRVVADVAHVDAPRRIGEHLEDVGLGLGAVAVGAEALLGFPPRLPAAIGGGRVETPVAHRVRLIRRRSLGGGRGPWSG